MRGRHKAIECERCSQAFVKHDVHRRSLCQAKDSVITANLCRACIKKFYPQIIKQRASRKDKNYNCSNCSITQVYKKMVVESLQLRDEIAKSKLCCKCFELHQIQMTQNEGEVPKLEEQDSIQPNSVAEWEVDQIDTKIAMPELVCVNAYSYDGLIESLSLTLDHNLIGRQSELKLLYDMLQNQLQSGYQTPIMIQGAYGTGKTMIVDQVARLLNNKFDKTLNVNCLYLEKPQLIYKQIYNCLPLKQPPRKNQNYAEWLNLYFSNETSNSVLSKVLLDCNSNRCKLLLTVDESDGLVNEQRTIYNLTEWSTRSVGFHLVLIANKDFRQDLQQKVKSRIGNNFILVTQYTGGLFQEILIDRLGCNNRQFPLSAIKYVARKVAAHHGDIRYLFKLCIQSVETADRNSEQVTIEQIEQTFQDLFKPRTVKVIQCLQKFEVTVIAALLHENLIQNTFEFRQKVWVKGTDCFNTFLWICKQLHYDRFCSINKYHRHHDEQCRKPIRYSQYTSIVKRLVEFGLIDIDHKQSSGQQVQESGSKTKMTELEIRQKHTDDFCISFGDIANETIIYSIKYLQTIVKIVKENYTSIPILFNLFSEIYENEDDKSHELNKLLDQSYSSGFSDYLKYKHDPIRHFDVSESVEVDDVSNRNGVLQRKYGNWQMNDRSVFSSIKSVKQNENQGECHVLFDCDQQRKSEVSMEVSNCQNDLFVNPSVKHRFYLHKYINPEYSDFYYNYIFYNLMADRNVSKAEFDQFKERIEASQTEQAALFGNQFASLVGNMAQKMQVLTQSIEGLKQKIDSNVGAQQRIDNSPDENDSELESIIQVKNQKQNQIITTSENNRGSVVKITQYAERMYSEYAKKLIVTRYKSTSMTQLDVKAYQSVVQSLIVKDEKIRMCQVCIAKLTDSCNHFRFSIEEFETIRSNLQKYMGCSDKIQVWRPGKISRNIESCFGGLLKDISSDHGDYAVMSWLIGFILDEKAGKKFSGATPNGGKNPSNSQAQPSSSLPKPANDKDILSLLVLDPAVCCKLLEHVHLIGSNQYQEVFSKKFDEIWRHVLRYFGVTTKKLQAISQCLMLQSTIVRLFDEIDDSNFLECCYVPRPVNKKNVRFQFEVIKGKHKIVHCGNPDSMASQQIQPFDRVQVVPQIQNNHNTVLCVKGGRLGVTQEEASSLMQAVSSAQAQKVSSSQPTVRTESKDGIIESDLHDVEQPQQKELKRLISYFNEEKAPTPRRRYQLRNSSEDPVKDSKKSVKRHREPSSQEKESSFHNPDVKRQKRN